MKQLIGILLFIVIVTSMTSCFNTSVPKPDKLIPKDKFVKIMVDIYLMQSVNIEPLNLKNQKKDTSKIGLKNLINLKNDTSKIGMKNLKDQKKDISKHGMKILTTQTMDTSKIGLKKLKEIKKITSTDLYYSVLKKYSVADTVFVRSLIYYSSIPKEYEKMHVQIMAILNESELQFKPKDKLNMEKK